MELSNEIKRYIERRDARIKSRLDSYNKDEWTQEESNKHPRSSKNGRFVKKGVSDPAGSLRIKSRKSEPSGEKNLGKKTHTKKEYIKSESPISTRLSKDTYDTINDGIHSIESKGVQWVAEQALNTATFDIPEGYDIGDDSDKYLPELNAIYLTQDAADGIDCGTAGETPVHECFHYMDYNFPDGPSEIPYSETYCNGIFRKTINKEIDSYFRKVLGLSMKQVIDMDADDREQLMGNILNDLWDRGFSGDDMGDFSDMMCAATGEKFDLGTGHFGGYYIVEDDDEKDLIKYHKSSEAFAEFGSAYTVNPKSKELLRQILPKSSKVFEEMCTFMHSYKKRGGRR